MSEQPETPKILDDIAKSNTAKAGGSRSRQQNARRRFLLVVMLFLPILAGVAFLAYQQFRLQSQLQALNEENRQLNSTVAAQNSQLLQVQQQLTEVPQALEIDDSSVRQVEQNLNQELNQLRQQLADLQSQQLSAQEEPSFEWKLLEAEYLLGIASHKLQLEADLNSAITLLESADNALLESGINGVFTLRQAIASELGELRAVQPLDREGLYLRIGDLASRVDEIDLLGSMRQTFENRRGNESAPVQIGSANGGVVDSTLQFLSSIFVWRKWEETPDAMLAPGQDRFIKQNLRLLLEQSQLAILGRDGELYRRSLSDAGDWLRSYGVTDSNLGQSFLAELEQLQAIDVNPPLPSLDRSLGIIRQLTSNER